MALEQHIESLKRKHAKIDQIIRDQELHMGADQLDISHLKALKLNLKDEIERLTIGQRAAA